MHRCPPPNGIGLQFMAEPGVNPFSPRGHSALLVSASWGSQGDFFFFFFFREFSSSRGWLLGGPGFLHLFTSSSESLLKKILFGFPCWSRDSDSTLPLQGAQVDPGEGSSACHTVEAKNKPRTNTFVCLAVLGVSCGMRETFYLHCSTWGPVPGPRIARRPLCWECGVRPPGKKPPELLFNTHCC